MLTTCVRIAIYIFTASAALVVTDAHAVQRTHVSAAFGNDANTATNCTAAAPCRFFTAAMTVTDNNGEVIVLDSGGYGAVTITQSVALIAPTGVYAGISVFPGANGVTIATPGINVVLRGLTINGQGGNDGINMTAGNSLTVENCVISNLGRNGIYVNTAASVKITDTIIRRNGTDRPAFATSVVGLYLLNGARGTITRAIISANRDGGVFVVGDIAGTNTTAHIADSTVDENGIGGNGGSGIAVVSRNATAVVNVSVRDSRLVLNTSCGVITESQPGAALTASVSNNIIAKNSCGILSNSGRIWASGNTVSDNSSTGMSTSPTGVIESAGNNAVRNNGININTNGVFTVVATQ